MPRQHSPISNGKPHEDLDQVVVVGKRSRKSLVKKYWELRNSGRSISEAPKDMRNWLYRYDRTERFLERVREMRREQDIIALEIGSFFVPGSWLTKLRYLKYAKYLNKIKRGGTVVAQATGRAGGKAAQATGKALTWVGKNYGKDFTIEFYKEAAANWRNLKEMDMADVLISTIGSKFKDAWAKGVVEAINAGLDGKVTGFQVAGYNKGGSDVFMDALFGSISLAGGEIGDGTNANEFSKQAFEVLLDQTKAAITSERDKQNKKQ